MFRWKKGISPGKITWSRFRRNPLALSGMVLICLAFLVSLFAYVISPDQTPNANTQILEIATERPGFRADFIRVRYNRPSAAAGWMEGIFRGRESDYRYIPVDSVWIDHSRLVYREYSRYREDEFISGLLIPDIIYPIRAEGCSYRDGIWEVALVSGETIRRSGEDLIREVLEDHLVRKQFWLGTDRFGRDLLSRIIIGTRVSFSVGFIAVFISLLVGVVLGGIAGFFRGMTDKVIMWFVNVVWSIPTLLMVISITLVLGKGYWQVFVAVGLTMWVEVARVVRGQVISIREMEYVEAARAIGARPVTILARHILPNVIAPVVIISAANFATAILMEAGLSFLGIGVQPPVPSWGGMIKDHYGFIIVNKGFLAFIPGFAIMLMVLAFTMVGNGLRDALDTRSDQVNLRR
ncbi:MAG TPA: ABC transporter permease [Bacteroides sp.]|nr:ABC transporter permease [Bacteroides sp.]